MEQRLKRTVEFLCSERCAGRQPGTEGSALARERIAAELREAGLEAIEQPVPGCSGTNLLASLPGESDRWLLVAAHYDHLGRQGSDLYVGADDNAAGVAIALELARRLAGGPRLRRGVVLAFFDAEEPPNFETPAMGSQYYASNPLVPLSWMDLMVCLDLVGHAVGPPGLPDDLRSTVLAMGAERGEGMSALVDRLARAEPGVVVRRLDAEVIPPLSDYAAFWRSSVPFLFLTNGRTLQYHTPQDTPDRLDFAKMAATARWLERLVRALGALDAPSVTFQRRRDDASTLRTLVELGRLLPAPKGPKLAHHAERLLSECAGETLPEARRSEAQWLAWQLEAYISSANPQG